MKTYFLQAINGGPIKIGKTSGDVYKRIKGVQTGNPYQLKVLCCTENHSENELHKKFYKHKMSGEWFKDDVEIYQFIESITGIKFKNKRTNPFEEMNKHVKFLERYCDFIKEEHQEIDEFFLEQVDGANWSPWGDCFAYRTYNKANYKHPDLAERIFNKILSGGCECCPKYEKDCDSPHFCWTQAIKHLIASSQIIENIGINVEKKEMWLSILPLSTKSRCDCFLNCLLAADELRPIGWSLFGKIDDFPEIEKIDFLNESMKMRLEYCS